jgi:hypothetical protein
MVPSYPLSRWDLMLYQMVQGIARMQLSEGKFRPGASSASVCDNSCIPSPIEIGFRHTSHEAIVAIYGHVLLGFASFSWLNQCRIALLDHLMLEAPFPARFVDTTAPACSRSPLPLHSGSLSTSLSISNSACNSTHDKSCFAHLHMDLPLVAFDRGPPRTYPCQLSLSYLSKTSLG